MISMQLWGQKVNVLFNINESSADMANVTGPAGVPV